MLELWYFTWKLFMIRPFHGYHFFATVTLTLEFDLLFENFNLANNFWTVSARALIFQMSIPYYKTFLWVPLFLRHLLWSWSLTYLLKTLTLLINFKQRVLELWYFTWVLLLARPFRVYQQFWPCDLYFGVWLTFEYFNLINNIWIVSARALIIHMSIPYDRIFLLVLTFFFKLTSVITSKMKNV